MRRGIRLAAALLILPAALLRAQDAGSAVRIEARIEALISAGNYSRAFTLLNEAVQDSSVDPVAKAESRLSLAEFYEEQVGDYTGAAMLYGAVAREGTDPASSAGGAAGDANSPAQSGLARIASRAAAAKAELEARAEAFAEEDRTLSEIRAATGPQTEEAVLRVHVTRLEDLVGREPPYYRESEALYYLGMNLAHLGKLGAAVARLEEAVAAKPAMRFFLDVEFQLDTLRTKHARRTAGAIATSVLAVLLGAGAVLFYASRPWRGLRSSAWLVLAGALALWAGVFFASSAVFARTVPTDELAAKYTGECPAFVSAAYGTPGSAVLNYLLAYGAVGVVGVFGFAVAVRRRLLWLRVGLTTTVGLLLFSALATLYYLDYCSSDGTFESIGRPDTVAYYARGSVLYFLRDPEPFILTDPLAYPNLVVLHTDDDMFAEWIVQHCPFDNVIPGEPAPEE